jgi:hypothetical protein
MVYNTQQQHRYVEGDEQSIKRVVINLVRYYYCYYYCCYCSSYLLLLGAFSGYCLVL